MGPLELPATPHLLRRLARRGLFTGRSLEQALRLIGHIPGLERWARFLDWLLLALGLGLVVSGVFFFFAFNWAGLNRFAKLGVLEAAVALAAVIAYWQKLEALPGKLALTAAALLVGALLAGFGQIYQTGADAYQLFLLWAALITGWVLIARFTPLWLIWLGLLNLTAWFYGLQAGGFDGPWYLGVFALNALPLAAWEWGHRRGAAWLKSRWAPRLLALPALAALTVPALQVVTAPASAPPSDPWLLGLTGLYAVVCLSALVGYARLTLDLFILLACAVSLLLLFDAWFVTLLPQDTFTLFVMATLLIAQAGFVVAALRRVAGAWEARA